MIDPNDDSIFRRLQTTNNRAESRRWMHVGWEAYARGEALAPWVRPVGVRNEDDAEIWVSRFPRKTQHVARLIALETLSINDDSARLRNQMELALSYRQLR